MTKNFLTSSVLIIGLSFISLVNAAEFSEAMREEALKQFNCGAPESCSAAFHEAFRNGNEVMVKAFRDFGLKWQLYREDDIVVAKNDSSLAIVKKAKEINSCGENVGCILEKVRDLVNAAQTGKDKNLAKAVANFEIEKGIQATEAIYATAKKLGKNEFLNKCASGDVESDLVSVCAGIADSAAKEGKYKDIVKDYVGEDRIKSGMVDGMTRLNLALEEARDNPASELRILEEEADVEDAEDVGYVCMKRGIEERFKSACLAAARIFDPTNGEKMMREAWNQVDFFYDRKNDAFTKIEAIMRENSDPNVIVPKLQELLSNLPSDTPPFVLSELKRMIGEMQRYNPYPYPITGGKSGPIYDVTESECRNKSGVWSAAGINYKGKNVNCYVAETSCLYPTVMPRRCEPGEKPTPPPPRGFPWECPPFNSACIPDYGQPTACHATYKDSASCNTQPNCYWTGDNCRSKYCPVYSVPPPTCASGQNPLGPDGCEVCTSSRDIGGEDKIILVVRYGDALEKKTYSKKEAAGVCKSYPDIYSMNAGICASLIGEQPTPKVCPPLPAAPAGVLCSGGKIEKWGKKDYGNGLMCPVFEGCEESRTTKTGPIEGATTQEACSKYYSGGAIWSEPDKVCYYPPFCPLAPVAPCPFGTSRKPDPNYRPKPWECGLEIACTEDTRPTPISSPLTEAQVACLRGRGVPETTIGNIKRAGDGFTNFTNSEIEIMKGYMPVVDACRTCTNLANDACWNAGVCYWDRSTSSCKVSSSVKVGDISNILNFTCPAGWEPKVFGTTNKVNGCIKTGSKPPYLGVELADCRWGYKFNTDGWPTGECMRAGEGTTPTGAWTEFTWSSTIKSMIAADVTTAQKDTGKLVVENCARTLNRSIGMSDIRWNSQGVPEECTGSATVGGGTTPATYASQIAFYSREDLKGCLVGKGITRLEVDRMIAEILGDFNAGRYPSWFFSWANRPSDNQSALARCESELGRPPTGGGMSSGGTGTPPAGQKQKTWNSYGLMSWIRDDASPTLVAQLEEACKYVPSWAGNVWSSTAGDYNSSNFGMPNKTTCETYTTPPTGSGMSGSSCGALMTISACTANSSCSWNSTSNYCYVTGYTGSGMSGTVPAGQRQKTWNTYGLMSSIRADADSARIARLEAACVYVPSWASNVWSAGAGDYSSANFGMPNEDVCKTYTTPPSASGTSSGGMNCPAPSWNDMADNGSWYCRWPDNTCSWPGAAAKITCPADAYPMTGSGMSSGGSNCGPGYYWNGSTCVVSPTGGAGGGSCPSGYHFEFKDSTRNTDVCFRDVGDMGDGLAHNEYIYLNDPANVITCSSSNHVSGCPSGGSTTSTTGGSGGASMSCDWSSQYWNMASNSCRSRTECYDTSSSYYNNSECMGVRGSYSGGGSSYAGCSSNQYMCNGACINMGQPCSSPGGSSASTCASGQYWYTPPGGGAGYCMSSGGSLSCSSGQYWNGTACVASMSPDEGCKQTYGQASSWNGSRCIGGSAPTTSISSQSFLAQLAIVFKYLFGR